MSDFRKKPSGWLMYNSMGFPDFLFTILTYAMILLGAAALAWIFFGVIAYISADPGKSNVALQIMDSMYSGLMSLAGVIFGLAGSYTVRRFKKDEHYVEKKRLDTEIEMASRVTKERVSPPVQEGLSLVLDEEDI